MANPIISALINQFTAAPGFKETLAKITAFVDGCESRLARIEAELSDIRKALDVDTQILQEDLRAARDRGTSDGM